MPSRRLSSTYHLITVLALVVFSAGARPLISPSSDDLISVTLAGRDSLSAEPGQIVTAAFVISNSSQSNRVVKTATKLPDGWRLISINTNRSEIKRGTSKTILVSIKVNQNAGVRSYPVVFSISDTENPEEQDSSTLMVNVQQKDQLSITVLDSPSFVVAGDDLEVNLMVINSGNAPVVTSTTISTVPFTKSQVDPERATVAPGSEQFVTIVVKTSSNLTSRRRQLVTIRVIPDHDPEAAVEAIVWADVLPAGRSISDASSIPAYIRATGLRSDRGKGAQVEFGARGQIVEGEDHFIDLLIRTPDLASTSLYGTRDEYRLEYSSENVSVRLGDHPFGWSPLTEYGRLGRGAGVEVGSGKVSAGAFVSRNRVIFPRENQLGGTLKFELHERADFSANYLQKNGIEGGQSISIRTQLRPVKSTTLDLEIGDGNNSGVHSSGYSFAARTDLEWMSASARYIGAGPQFPGYYSDFETMASSIVLKPDEKLRLEGMYQRQSRGFQENLAFGSTSASTSSTFYQAGPVFEAKVGRVPLHMAMNYQWRQTQTTGSFSQVDQTEAMITVRAGAKLWKFNVGSKIERGEVKSQSLGQSLPARRYEFSTGMNLGRVNYNVAIERLNGASLYRLQERNITILKVTGDAALTRRTRFNMDAFSIYDPVFASGRYSFVQAELQHKFDFGHILTFNSGFTALESLVRRPRTDVGISYEIPVGLPRFGKRKRRMYGRVLDSETGQGASRVRLSMDDQVAVTNSNGEYSFVRRDSGTRYIILDQSSIGIHQTSLSANPFQFYEDNDLADLPVIYLANSGAIVGSIRFEDGSAVLGAVVEVSDAVGKMRVIVNDSGEFEFNKLRPGEWVAKVVYARVPTLFQPEQQAYHVTVNSGRSETISITYKEEKREIKFVARGVAGNVVQSDSTTVVGDVERRTIRRASPAPSESTLVSDAIDVDTFCTALTNVVAVNHAVTVGETLRDVTVKYYCDPFYWPHVWNANRPAFSYDGALTADPILLIPGLRRPSSESSVTPAKHDVLPGETLSVLARKYFGDYGQWPRIWITNQDLILNPDVIFPGMSLQIPASTRLHEREIKFIETPLPLKD